MIVVIAAVAVVGVMMITMLSAAVDSSKWTDSQVETFQVEAAAETAVALVASNLWTGFERDNGGAGGLIGFQNYLENQGVTNQTQAQASANPTDYRGRMSLPSNNKGTFMLDGVDVDSLTVRREDGFDSTRLFIEAATSNGLASAGDQASTFRVQHVYEIGSAEWSGTEFALLSNNVNCLLCHTEVDNSARFYNEDATQYGTFDRVRLGSIETFHVREDPMSKIAGSLYLGGDAVLEDGSRINDWHSLSLDSASFDHTGLLQEDAWGGLAFNALNPANGLNPDPMENLYLDYLAGGEAMQVDGSLPSNFPSAFPDNGGIDMATGNHTPEFGGNRKVDDNEFLAATAGATGTVTGGKISIMEKNWRGKVKNNGALNKMRNGNSPSVSGQTDANVYLHGTEANPIVLNGEVAIDGDLIITGYVKGVGALKVSGNVYMPSDVQYLDGVSATGGRTYGVAADGTQNTLAIASGGNVVIGDYYRPAWGSGKDTNGWSGGSFNFIMEEMATFNRMEWMKTQQTLPGEMEYVMTGMNIWDEKKERKVKETYKEKQTKYKWVKTGKKIKKTKYKWIKVSNGKPAPYTAYSNKKVVDYHYWVDETKKVADGFKWVNKTRWVGTGVFDTIHHEDEIWEWVRPQYDNPYFQGDGFIPRYYSFGKNTWIPIPNKKGHFDPNAGLWMAEELQGKWDGSKMNYARESNKNDPYLFDENGDPTAVVMTVAPDTNWIDANRMTKLLKDIGKTRDNNKDLTIDAAVYSNNSIFGVVADDKRSGTNGKLLVNGLIVAADVGLLAPEGTQINYDPRGRPLMDIQSDNSLEIRVHIRTPLP